MWKQLEENKPQNAESRKQKSEGDGQSAESKMQKIQANAKQKLSFKEKAEFENLEDEIAELEKEKELLEVRLSNGSTDFEKLQETSEKINDIIVLIDKKETRWLELSERAAL
jgi:ATP-binding cassette subfamily F protein uup